VTQEDNNMNLIKTAGLATAALLALGVTSASAEKGGAKRFAPGQSSKATHPTARNAAPGQQMLNNRTQATAPGNSFNAPGQRMIRARTPGGTR
jgi:hypothetical protein